MKPRVPTIPTNWPEITGLLAGALAGGAAASALGFPMPFLIGSLIVSAAYAMWVSSTKSRAVAFPRPLRYAFIAVIGAMIGATFTPDLLQALPSLWPSLIGLSLFVMLAHALVYLLFRRIGRYDRPTALFAAMPGGLVEAITLGEQAGGDVRILTVQHFARIIIVVVTVPALFLLWNGIAVGSAAGQSFASAPAGAADIALIVALAAIGAPLGLALRIPAGQLMGALLLSAAVHVLGLASAVSPQWLLNLAQLVIGAGLGAQFSSVSAGLLGRTFGLGLLSVALMLSLGFAFAAALALWLPVPFDALFISYAPGGVTEMGLIALSLQVSPVIVAAHHLYRISFTVLMVGWIAKSRHFGA
ncbi:MAG: AbrB family transcriptional regulator [Rhodobacter sp.]|nr:AbrB family transcriptional regulator [Rhodobacter sp.]